MEILSIVKLGSGLVFCHLEEVRTNCKRKKGIMWQKARPDPLMFYYSYDISSN